MEERQYRHSVKSIAASICFAMGVEPPKDAEAPNPLICEYLKKAFGGEKADRVLMFHPDAVAEWIFRKYDSFLKAVTARAKLEVSLETVMPSVTPVCFGSMYTGAAPEKHGITRYEKKLIVLDTVFDAMIRAGKKPVIVADTACSMGKIFLERKMDYELFDTVEEINARAAELIEEDRHDLYVVYNGNYDHEMHRFGPEDTKSLAELRCNASMFGSLLTLAAHRWERHNVFAGFATDHGCHEIDGGLGSHGLDMPEDLNILHCYQAIPRKKL